MRSHSCVTCSCLWHAKLSPRAYSIFNMELATSLLHRFAQARYASLEPGDLLYKLHMGVMLVFDPHPTKHVAYCNRKPRIKRHVILSPLCRFVAGGFRGVDLNLECCAADLARRLRAAADGSDYQEGLSDDEDEDDDNDAEISEVEETFEQQQHAALADSHMQTSLDQEQEEELDIMSSPAQQPWGTEVRAFPLLLCDLLQQQRRHMGGHTAPMVIYLEFRV